MFAEKTTHHVFEAFTLIFFQKRWRDIPCVTSERGKSPDICFSPARAVSVQSKRQGQGNMAQAVSSQETNVIFLLTRFVKGWSK